MKKIILTTSLFLIGSSLLMSQSIKNIKHQKVETKNDVIKPMTSKSPSNSIIKPKTTVLWSNQFDDADDWTIVNSSSTHDAWVFTSAPYTQSILDGTGFTTLESTTNNNGYALINSDAAYAGDGNGQLVGTMTNVTPIDLSGQPDVLLMFEHNYRWWNDSRGVRVSVDNGANWEEFPITDNAGYPDQQSSANPKMEVIDISSVAGGQEEVLIQFYYDDNNFWGWYWAVDDAEIIVKPDNDVATNSLYFGTNGLHYYQIPVSQIAPIDATVTIENRGINAQTGVALEVSETNVGTFSGTSQTVTIAPNAEDSLILSTPFTPSGAGNFTLEFELANDAVDEIPSNNEMSNYSFEVGQYIYARDNGNATGSYAPEVPMQLGNLFEAQAAAELTGVDVQFGTIMAEGAEVTGELYIITPDGNFQFEAETQMYISSSTDAGELITLPFPSSVTLIAGETYLLTVGSTFDEFSIATGGTSATQTSFVFGDVGTAGEDWYFTTSTPMVRMNFDPALSTSNDEFLSFKVNLYPNPAKEAATLEFNLESTSNVSVEVTDLTGKTIYNTSTVSNAGVNQLNIPTASLTDGIYIYKLVINGNVISNKFVVSK